MGKLLYLKMQGVSAILVVFSNFRFPFLPGLIDYHSCSENACLKKRGPIEPNFWRMGK
jgi:hypothetical protein